MVFTLLAISAADVLHARVFKLPRDWAPHPRRVFVSRGEGGRAQTHPSPANRQVQMDYGRLWRESSAILRRKFYPTPVKANAYPGIARFLKGSGFCKNAPCLCSLVPLFPRSLAPRSLVPSFPCSLFPAPCSLFPRSLVPLFPVPCSLVPLFPVPCSLVPSFPVL